MAYFLYYKSDSGTLLDITQTQWLDVPPYVTEVNSPDAMPNLGQVQWEPSTLTFAPRATNGILTKLQFLSRLTMAERIHISTLKDNDPILQDILMLLNLATEIHLYDQDTISSVWYLVSINVISATRAQQILAY